MGSNPHFCALTATPARLAGLGTGFLGVIVLVSRDLQPGGLETRGRPSPTG